MRLSELVKVRQEQCPVCVSYVYQLPHNIDRELCKSLEVFGPSKYSIKAVKLFKVEYEDWYVECIQGTKTIKLWFKKSLGPDIERRIQVFRGCLVEWLSDRFSSDIEE